jgi:hypothetical protein
VGGYFFIHRKTIFPLLDKKNPRAEVRVSRYHREEVVLWEEGAYYTPKELHSMVRIAT